jgi:AcrR family transcriptional regulator
VSAYGDAVATGRTRAQIVQENDRALRAAVAAMAAETGWDSVTFTGVARRAGLTVGAVYGRAESPAELGIDLWEAQVGPWFREVYARVMEAGMAGDPKAVIRALHAWDENPDLTGVAVDLLIASMFDDELAEVTGAEVGEVLAAHCLPSHGPRVSARRAAAGTLLSSFALGRAIAIRGGARLAPLTAQQGRALAGLHGSTSTRTSIPKPPPLTWVRPMDALDTQTQALLRGTLAVVGKVGYTRATIARISRGARVPRGSVMSHYATKAELIGEAARHALIPPAEVWAQYDPVVTRHGPLVSRAMFLADFLQPGNRALWRVNLELARVARFIPELAEFRANANVLEHTHLGVMMAASMLPDLSTLPYVAAFQAGSAT